LKERPALEVLSRALKILMPQPERQMARHQPRLAVSSSEPTSNTSMHCPRAMKNVKPKGDHKPLTWEVNKETKDFGACRL
jgi:hypothetical protein